MRKKASLELAKQQENSQNDEICFRSTGYFLLGSMQRGLNDL
jgi:hypothetical protein